jgi:hypothetical protein
MQSTNDHIHLLDAALLFLIRFVQQVHGESVDGVDGISKSRVSPE